MDSSVCVVFIFVNMEVGMEIERCEDGGSGEQERWAAAFVLGLYL